MNTTSSFLQNAITDPFRNKDWGTKLLIGGMLFFASTFLPIVPALFVLGYLYRIQRRVIIEKRGPQLPEWDDWGQLLQDGLKYMGVVLVYMLPVILIMIGGYVLMMVFPLTLVTLADIAQAGKDMEPLLGLLSMLGFIGGVVIMLLASLLSIAVGLVLPAGLAHMCALDRFGAAFEINVWIKNWRANVGGYVLASVVIMGISWAAMFVLSFTYFAAIVCCLLPALAMGFVYYYLGVLSANLYANAYVEGQAKTGLPEIEALAVSN